MDGFAIWVHGYKFECSLHSFACPTRRGTAQEYTSQENQCHAFDRLKNIDRWRVILRLKLRASGFGATYVSSSRKAAGLGFWSWQWSLRFCVDDLRRLRLSTADYPRFLSFLSFLIGFLIPGERLEGQELPQRITSEVRNSDLDSSLIWNVLCFLLTPVRLWTPTCSHFLFLHLYRILMGLHRFTSWFPSVRGTVDFNFWIFPRHCGAVVVNPLSMGAWWEKQQLHRLD